MLKSGLTLLIIVLIICAAGLVLAASSLWLGVDHLALAQAGRGQNVARHLAESCLELALLKLKNNPAYVGESLSLPAGECIIMTTAGNPVQFNVTANEENYWQKITASVQASSHPWQLLSWQEEAP